MTIQVRRGLKANLPASAVDGQPLFAEDTQELYFGTGPSVVPIKIAGANVIGGAGGDTPGTPHHFVSVHSINARVIQASPGVVTGWTGYCNQAGTGPCFVKLFDQTTSPDPAGGDLPVVVIPMQMGVAAPPGPAGGVRFLVGIAMCIVKGIEDDDDTVVAKDDATIDIFVA
jgi:hypothetical protein